jgi:CheY-like chemotaxis protein/DNA-binding XRE family transcriptional regulator
VASTKPVADNLKRAFGNAVKVRRNRMGISQDELAWRAAVHRTYVTNVERGICNPSLSSISKMAKALGTTITTLLADVESESRPPGSQPSASSVDILLVEDSDNDVELTVEALKSGGLANTVHVARDGAEALDYFFSPQGRFAQGNGQPRLILLDLNLPKLSGLEVLQRLKADKRTSSIPVIVLTVSQTTSDIAECRRLGANAYIAKPVNFRNLSEVTPQLNLCWLLLQNPARATA